MLETAISHDQNVIENTIFPCSENNLTLALLIPTAIHIRKSSNDVYRTCWLLKSENSELLDSGRREGFARRALRSINEITPPLDHKD
jgi:hypothetical protein